MLPFDDKDLALPRGSLILVTGTSGLIGSHVANEALRAGYRVRGTSRSQERADFTGQMLQNPSNYSSAIVPDVQVDGAWDEAMKGVDAIIHLATDLSFNPNPYEVVKPMEEGVRNILRSAQRAGSVKRFVFASSTSAAIMPGATKEVSVSVDDWCQEALDEAWKPPPYTPERAFFTYAASKVAGEKALWDFVKENEPGFIANAVLPSFNAGRILTSGGPTAISVGTLLKGEVPDVAPRKSYLTHIRDSSLELTRCPRIPHRRHRRRAHPPHRRRARPDSRQSAHLRRRTPIQLHTDD